MAKFWMYDQKEILDIEKVVKANHSEGPDDGHRIFLTMDYGLRLKYLGPQALALWNYLANQSYAQDKYEEVSND